MCHPGYAAHQAWMGTSKVQHSIINQDALLSECYKKGMEVVVVEITMISLAKIFCMSDGIFHWKDAEDIWMC